MPSEIPILATKLFLPPARPTRVPRPRLTSRISEGLTRPLTLISSPAGSGKTTLLSEWAISGPGRAYALAWLSLDAEDNDPARFLTYLIAALATARPGLGDAPLAMLRSFQAVPPGTVLSHLIAELCEAEAPLALVLDDYHLISAQAVHDCVAFLLDHMPPQLHLVILTRADPPLPLGRLRALGGLAEIRAADLRFTTEETTTLLNRIMGFNLSIEDVTALGARTEGWIAGLHLAALSMQGRSDVTGFVKAFTGSQVYISEYLVQEVLSRQPDDAQTFLLKTSILDRMSADLCRAVTGCEDAQAILTAFQRANAFVIPLDDEGHWYRYHHLFADLLRSRLTHSIPAEDLGALHLRTAAWHEANGLTAEAVRHGLAAGDFERVASLVEHSARSLIFAGRMGTLRDWLEALPEASFRDHPQLTFYQFWIDLLQGKADLSERAVQEKEDLIKALPPSPENDRLRGEVMAVVCRAMVLSGRTSRGIGLAQEALEYLSDGDPASRARANSALAIAHGLEGRAAEADRAYQECLPQAVAAGDYRLAAHTTMVMALNQCHYGKLHAAASSFQSIIDLGARAHLTPEHQAASPVFFPAGLGYIGLASIELEWNHLEKAEDYLKQGMELCRQGGMDGNFHGRILMSRLLQAKGDLEGALEEVHSAQQSFQRADDFAIASRKVQISLAQGDVDGASGWAAPLMEMLGSDSAPSRLPVLLSEVVQAIIVRVYLAQGESGKALQLLDKLQATAEPARRIGRLIEVGLLRSLALQKHAPASVSHEAAASLEQALELAEPEGYALLFLEEGPALVPLLKAVVNRQSTPVRLKRYAHVLLEAFPRHGHPFSPPSPGEAQGLVESLTPREMEVLQLIAAGASNQSIAETLVITVRTVKKHTGNIYGKLDANSRTQAVARARELGLLSTN